MSEQSSDEQAPDALAEARTGDARVDGVLDLLADLEGRPVAEHVAVFEKAHDELRTALDARPDGHQDD